MRTIQTNYPVKAPVELVDTFFGRKCPKNFRNRNPQPLMILARVKDDFICRMSTNRGVSCMSMKSQSLEYFSYTNSRRLRGPQTTLMKHYCERTEPISKPLPNGPRLIPIRQAWRCSAMPWSNQESRPCGSCGVDCFGLPARTTGKRSASVRSGGYYPNLRC